jgi:RHS repeat-associated protein
MKNQVYGNDGSFSNPANGNFPNPLSTSREWDAESTSYYYRARYYTPAVGRFNVRDPIGYGGGLNLYSYVGNNSVNRTDPFGYFGCCNHMMFMFGCTNYWSRKEEVSRNEGEWTFSTVGAGTISKEGSVVPGAIKYGFGNVICNYTKQVTLHCKETRYCDSTKIGETLYDVVATQTGTLDSASAGTQPFQLVAIAKYWRVPILGIPIQTGWQPPDIGEGSQQGAENYCRAQSGPTPSTITPLDKTCQ